MSYSDCDGCVTNFKYNADGIRISKNYINYLLDGTKIIEESDGLRTIKYLYGEGGIIGFNYENTDYYYRKNIQGDILEIYTSTGTKVASYVYDAWGKILEVNEHTNSGIGNLNPFRYRSYYYDVETGLYYLNSRYYDPETGRFINVDNAIATPGNDIRGYNLYSYCFNNPITLDDSDGDWPKWIDTAANWVNKNITQPVGKVVLNAGRQIKNGFINTAKKIGNSVANAIEAKVLLGGGLGVSGEDCGAEVSKSIVIGIDNGAEYCGYEINAEIGVGIIGFSSTHTHLSEIDYSPIRCDSEHAYGRKTVFNILSCPDTIHSNSVNIGLISISSNGDVSLSLSGSIFTILGVGGSVGINLSEFFRGVFE